MVIAMISGQVYGGGTPTPTPIPDIFEYSEAPPVDEILPLVEDLMVTSEDCLLPCFWGFQLGENSSAETSDFVIDNFRQIPYISLSSEKEDPNNLLDPSTHGMDFYAISIPLSSKGGTLQVIFRFIDDVLVRSDIQLFKAVNWLDSNPFILSKLLDIYGEPSDVYMRYSPAPVIGYVLVVVYKEQGFIVEYIFGSNASAKERLTEERQLLVCNVDPTNDIINMTLQLDGNPIPLIEVLQPSLDDPSAFRPFWDIEAMTGLSVGEFTETFAGDSNACIEAYSLAELRELGYE